MLARSAVFDIYGDHLLAGSGWAPVAALVQLTGDVDVAPAATRTAISRMAREGWLAADTRHGVRGYHLTERARGRLTSAAGRIYTDAPAWDGHWHLVVVEHSTDRSQRARLQASMGYLGYARLAADTWVAPRRSDDLSQTLDLGYREFSARMDGDPQSFASSLWDLPQLGESLRAYDRWLTTLLQGFPADPTDQQCYVTRARALHEWRKFLFTDPGLPPQVLPSSWPGTDAAAHFRRVASRLRPGAAAYVQGCIEIALRRSASS